MKAAWGALALGAGCADLPEGWEDAQPVDALVQSACLGDVSVTTTNGEITVDRRIEVEMTSRDPLTLEVSRASLRCDQAVEGFWQVDGDTVEVLYQPKEMHPKSVAKCTCPYDLSITVGSLSPTPSSAAVYARGDAYGDDDPVPELVGEVVTVIAR